MNKIKTLLSDGCTMAPDLHFRKCCELHDACYSNGSGVSRAKADQLLRECIKSKSYTFVGKHILSWVYWGAVRLFGWMRYNK